MSTTKSKYSYLIYRLQKLLHAYINLFYDWQKIEMFSNFLFSMGQLVCFVENYVIPFGTMHFVVLISVVIFWQRSSCLYNTLYRLLWLTFVLQKMNYEVIRHGCYLLSWILTRKIWSPTHVSWTSKSVIHLAAIFVSFVSYKPNVDVQQLKVKMKWNF